MELRHIQADDFEAVFRLLAGNGWSHARLGSIDRFGRLIEASDLALVAVVNRDVVAFARALTDGMSNGYLSMVVVAPEHRGQGIGRALVERVIGDDPNVTWVLRAGRSGASAFFARLGFAPSEIAMERRRAHTGGDAAGGCGTQQQPTRAMCRSIKTLFNFEPPATEDDVRAASLQFVRKLSGFNVPSRANEAAFARAVEAVTLAAGELINALVTQAPPRDRADEAAKARERWESGT